MTNKVSFPAVEFQVTSQRFRTADYNDYNAVFLAFLYDALSDVILNHQVAEKSHHTDYTQNSFLEYGGTCEF